MASDKAAVWKGNLEPQQIPPFPAFYCCRLTTLREILQFVTPVTADARAGGHYALRLDFVPSGASFMRMVGWTKIAACLVLAVAFLSAGPALAQGKIGVAAAVKNQ